MPQSIGCRHFGRSIKLITGYPNQRKVRDRLCAVLDDAPLRCVGDPYPLVKAHHSRCVGICIRPV